MIKQVKEYPNYKVTSDGYLIINGYGRSRKTKGVKHVDGMYRVLIANATQWEVRKLHELIAEAFIPNPNNLPEVKHIDLDTENNSPDNLQWITAEEYDSIPYTFNGELLWEIEGYPLYLISEDSHTIYSNKYGMREEMNVSEANSYALTDSNGKAKRKHRDEWYEDSIDTFSKKAYNELLKKYAADNDKTKEVVSLVNGKVYRDKYYTAEDSDLTTDAIVMHCNNIVKYPLYMWKEDWNGERLYDAPIRDLEIDEVYEDLNEAVEMSGYTSTTIWKHCNGKTKTNVRFEYAGKKLVDSEAYKGFVGS